MAFKKIDYHLKQSMSSHKNSPYVFTRSCIGLMMHFCRKNTKDKLNGAGTNNNRSDIETGLNDTNSQDKESQTTDFECVHVDFVKTDPVIISEDEFIVIPL